MRPPPTNLEQLRPSRKRLREGDVFALKPPGDAFYFGRVIDTDARPLRSIGGGILIYIYSGSAKVRVAPERLSPLELLVPPIMTNRLAWSRGYFETIEHRPIREGDVLDAHCFRDSYGRLWDERGTPLAEAVEPVGDAGLHSLRTIDDAISRALDLPLAPE